MRAKKTHPHHVKTRLFGEVERALRSGAKEIELVLSGFGARRIRLVAMHVMGDAILAFDPSVNPELSYSADIGDIGSVAGPVPTMIVAGNGLHAVKLSAIKELFLDGKAFALVPLAHRLRLAA